MLLIGWWTRGSWSEHRLQEEIARLESAGVLLSPEHLIPHVPEGERNAADLYEQAFRVYNLGWSERDTVCDFSDRSPERLALVREVVERNEGYYQLLDEAARTPHCAFPVDWANPHADTTSHYGKLREAASMLEVRADLLTVDGDYDGALAACATALRLAEHVKLEPSSRSQGVARAIQGITISALACTLAAGSPTPEACRRLFDQIATIDQIEPSVRALQGDLALDGMAIFALARAGDAKALSASLGFDEKAIAVYLTYGRPLLIADQITYLRHMEKLIAACAQPYAAAGDLPREAEAILEEAHSYASLITQKMADVFLAGQNVARRDGMTARLRATQIALALKAFHWHHGRYPDTLAELEGEGWSLPKDPFAVPEAAYGYSRDGDGFVVWSLGPDLDNDFGVSHQDRLRAASRTQEQLTVRRITDYDIVVRCPN
jgi:hypothetical protein